MKRSQLFALSILAILSAVAGADERQAWRAHYLANAGVMIARGDTKILFDPFFRSDFGEYDLVPADMEAALFAGSPPWDGIDAIFISHQHEDHFDPLTVVRFLERWQSVSLYAPQQAVDALPGVNEGLSQSVLDRVHAVRLEYGSAPFRLAVDGLIVEAVRIAHGGWPGRNADVENIVFRVTLDNVTTVMHMGDADAARELYEPHQAYWRARKSDLALVPVWLMLTDKGRFVLHEHVDAGHEIGMHVYKRIPDQAAERPPQFDGLDIFTVPGETRIFEE